MHYLLYSLYNKDVFKYILIIHFQHISTKIVKKLVKARRIYLKYEEVATYLEQIPKFSLDNPLENMKVLMQQFDHPQEALKTIHVAGTNGKGSVCAMLRSVLMTQGYKIGVFTSPHLIQYNERIQINDSLICNEDFASIGTEVIQKAKQMEQKGYMHPTFFEVITAMAFLYFHRKNIDIVLLEAGMGGRLDATNIITKPLLTIITSIGLDHQQILGTTIEQIAGEKAGIIKKERPLVLYSREEKVYNICKDVAFSNGSMLYPSHLLETYNMTSTVKGSCFSIRSSLFTYENLFIPLMGKHQVENAKLVLLAIDLLQKYGFTIDFENIYLGLKKTYWPGRMERYTLESLTLILDGAHNMQGLQAFLQTMEEIFPNQKIMLLFSAAQDKSHIQMLSLLSYCSKIKQIIVTRMKNKRSFDPKSLKIDERIQYIVESDLNTALKLSIKMAKKTGYILCCIGSLYLIGDIKKILYEEGLVNDSL